MKTVSLSGSRRENVGKKDAMNLRRNGKVPCVVYGGTEQIHLYGNRVELEALFATPEVCYIDLSVDGEKHLCITQEAQFHKVTGELLHVDFLLLNDNKAITLAVPLLVEGSSPGVLKGGKMIKGMRKIKVRSLPKNMPENIIVNISKLDVLDQIRIQDIPVGNYEIMEAKSTTVILIKASRNMVADAETPGKK